MLSVSAVIFDLDGLIVFTDEYHYLAWKVVADRLGVPFDREVNNRLSGVSRMQSLDIILNHGGIRLSDEEKTPWLRRKTKDLSAFHMENRQLQGYNGYCERTHICVQS